MEQRRNATQKRANTWWLPQQARVLGSTTVLLLALVSCTAVQGPQRAASRKGAIAASPSGVEAAWRDAEREDTKTAYIAFVRKHQDTHHTRKAIERLKRYAAGQQRYAVAAIRPRSKLPRTMSQAKITKDHGGGRLDTEGRVEFSLDPATGKLRNLFWHPGAEHTIVCTLTLEGYTFLSDPGNPLVFRVSVSHGYEYRGGHGLVIEPHDEIVSLGRAVSPDNVAQAGVEAHTDNQSQRGRGALVGRSARARRDAVARLVGLPSLAKAARKDRDTLTRSAAVDSLTDQDTLTRIALEDSDSDIRELAVTKLVDQSALARIALEGRDSVLRQTAVKKVADERALAQIAMEAKDWAVWRVAVAKLGDEALLRKLAMEAGDWAVRCAATRKLTDQVLLAKIAMEDAVPEIRHAAVQRLTDQAALAGVAAQAGDWAVRRSAVSKLRDQTTLARAAMEDADSEVRRAAAERLTDQALLAEVGMWVKPELTRQVTDQASLAKVAVQAKDEAVRLAAVERLSDQALLGKIASEDRVLVVRRAAMDRLTDQTILARIAVQAADAAVRQAAVGKLTVQRVLAEIAVKDRSQRVRSSAVERLTDQAVLTRVAVEDVDEAVRRAAAKKVKERAVLAALIAGEDPDETVKRATAKSPTGLGATASEDEHARDATVGRPAVKRLAPSGPPTGPSAFSLMGASDLKALIDRLEALHQSGDLDRMVAAARAKLAGPSTSAEAHFELGILLAAKTLFASDVGDGKSCFGQAIKHLETVLELSPGLAEAHSILGHLYMCPFLKKTDALEEAGRCFDRALELKPNEPVAREGRRRLALRRASTKERMDHIAAQLRGLSRVTRSGRSFTVVAVNLQESPVRCDLVARLRVMDVKAQAIIDCVEEMKRAGGKGTAKERGSTPRQTVSSMIRMVSESCGVMYSAAHALGLKVDAVGVALHARSGEAVRDVLVPCELFGRLLQGRNVSERDLFGGMRFRSARTRKREDR